MLMGACGHGHTEIAALLIQRGVALNAQDDRGTTALIQAVRSHRYDCSKLLLAKGADKSLRNKHGETALALAQKNRDAKAIQLLGK